MFAWAGQGAPWPHGCLEASGHLSGPGTSASPGPRQTGRPPPPWGLPPRPSSRHTVPTTFLEKSPGRAWGGQRMTSPARITQEPGADDPGAPAPEPAEVPSACPVPAMGSRVKAQPTVPLPCCHFPSPGLPVGAQWDSEGLRGTSSPFNGSRLQACGLVLLQCSPSTVRENASPHPAQARYHGPQAQLCCHRQWPEPLGSLSPPSEGRPLHGAGGPWGSLCRVLCAHRTASSPACGPRRQRVSPWCRRQPAARGSQAEKARTAKEGARGHVSGPRPRGRSFPRPLLPLGDVLAFSNKCDEP